MNTVTVDLSQASRVAGPLLRTDALAIRYQLAEHYDRSPSRRKETPVGMDLADVLQRKRAVWTLEEFSPTWNGVTGQWP